MTGIFPIHFSWACSKNDRTSWYIKLLDILFVFKLQDFNLSVTTRLGLARAWMELVCKFYLILRKHRQQWTIHRFFLDKTKILCWPRKHFNNYCWAEKQWNCNWCPVFVSRWDHQGCCLLPADSHSDQTRRTNGKLRHNCFNVESKFCISRVSWES